jgi:hypothetical protein
MGKTVNVIVSNNTSPLDQARFNKIIVVDFTKDIAEQEVTDVADISGVISSDDIYKAVETILAQKSQTVGVFGEDIVTSGRDVADVLNDISGAYFFVLSTTRNSVEMEDMAVWASAQKKIYIGQTDIAETAANAVTLAASMATDYAAVYAHKDEFLDMAIAGYMAPLTVGSATWAFKTLNGISTVDQYSSSDKTALTAGNVNFYENELGRDVTKYGLTTSGTYLDIVRSQEWLKNRIAENVTLRLFNTGKIPFTNAGFAIIEGGIAQVLEESKRMGITEKYVISMPKVADISANDKANRTVNGIKVTVYLQGAVESITINVSLEL